MLNVIQDELEVTRRGFVTNYPDFRQWRPEAAEQGLNKTTAERVPALSLLHSAMRLLSLQDHNSARNGTQ